jgi:1,4-alpha-glucan branching enzyme
MFEIVGRSIPGAGMTGLYEVEFRARAAPESVVFLAGSFNSWDPAAHHMRHIGDGLFQARVTLPPGRHEYKFVVNGEWMIDEECDRWVPNSAGTLNSVIDLI